MKNLAEIEVIVRNYLAESSAIVAQPIIDSVNFLSNLFSVDTIDATQSTVVDANTLDLPTNSLEVDTVFIDSVEIRKLKSLDDLQKVNDQSQQRFYEFNGKIQFTEDFTAVAATEIFYKKGFIEPETSVDTDVPERLLELVYIGAQVRYYNILIAKVATSRDGIPDAKIDDVRKVRDDLNKSYLEKIKIIQINL